MKKYFLLAAAAATVLAVSCNKEKNQPTTDPTPQIEDNTPQPIRFGTNIAEVKAPITKSAIENHGWDGTQDLYIYGLEFDGTDILLTSDGAADPTYAPYINEVRAASPNPSTTGVREAIEVYKTYTSDTDYTYYYYAGTKVYNFYGYYVGAAKIPDSTNPTTLVAAAGQATETADANTHKVSSIAIENLQIDGTNDIMIATTDKLADYAVVTPAPTVSLDKIYSATSARQGVVPDLMFQHLLSRFVFRTTYGGADNASYNTNRQKVKINSLKLKSPYKGTLTVYGQTPGFAADADEAEFTLEGVAAAGVNPGTATYGEYADLGTLASGTASILAVPKGDEQNVAKYDLILNITQDNGNNDVETQDVPLVVDFSKLENATKTYAEAGKQYLVKIVVYGLEDIQLTVSLEEWGAGGDVTIDPDNNDDRPVPTITVTPDPAATLNLNEGATQQITATAKYGDPEVTITAIKYGTTNKKVATVDDNGLITAVKTGDCKIFVYVEAANEYQGAMKTINVHVTAAATPTATALAGLDASHNIDNTSGNATWAITGVTVQAASVDIPTGYTLAYESSDPTIATVDANGEVTAVANGTATITVSYAGDATYAACQGTVAVTVSNTPVVPNP